jgi:hypothetical protein
LIERHNWFIHQGDVTTNLRIGINRRETLRLHKLLMHPDTGFEVDHINRNKLDNRRSNLRVVTHLHNLHNNAAHPNSQTGVRGVHPFRNKYSTKYIAFIHVSGKGMHLGTFATVEEAAVEVRAFKLAYGVWPL